VLAHASRPDDVVPSGRQVAECLDDGLRLEEIAVALVPVREGRAPFLDLPAPGRGAHVARLDELHELARQLAQSVGERADDGDVGPPELADLGWVDVEVDDLGARGEGAQLPGDAIVEAAPQRDDQVGLVQRPVRPLGTVHAGRAERERMRVREGALGHQRRHDRDPAQPGELEELAAGVRVDRAAADVQDRALRVLDRLRRLGDLQRMNLFGRPPPGQVNRIRVPEVDLRLLDVLGDVDEYRPGPAAAGNVERRLDRVGQLFDVLDEPGVLDDREGDSGRVGLLEGVGADQR
jgi:hypothetical protein